MLAKDPFHPINWSDDELDRVLADQFLEDYYIYIKYWRPNLGLQKVAPYCKQFVSSRQYEEPEYLNKLHINRKNVEDVEWCIDNNLELDYKVAILREMKNRERNKQAKAKVWSYECKVTYDQALDFILPIMKKRGLLDSK